MKGPRLVIFGLGIGASLLPRPVTAHHGNAAYETNKEVTIKGTVTDWLWSNPHCVLQLDASDASGQVAHWVLETENPSTMIRSGWTKDSFKIGDQLTVAVLQAKDGRRVGRIVEVILPDGHKLPGRGIPAIAIKPDDSPKP